jgi:hypothetical protein
VLRRVCIALVALAGLAVAPACGTPSGLDHQEQVAFARECASLIERNVSGFEPPVRGLGNETLDLADAAAFYATLGRLRGPQTFHFDDPADADRSPKDKLDEPCRTRAPAKSSSGATTTSTSTTSTTSSSSSTTSAP